MTVQAGLEPVEHAWCVTADGRVVEPTWDECGIAYAGFSQSFVFVVGALLDSRRTADIQRWEQDHP